MARESVRNNRIKVIGIFATVLFVMGVISLVFYKTSNHPKTINYKEKSNIDYKVYLKENDFYKDDYVGKDNQYISELINIIKTDFKYNLDFSNNLLYKYSYKVLAEIVVKDSLSENTIYRFEEELYKGDYIENSGPIEINKSVDVNYSKYNELINSFKNIYELRNSTSFINLTLYLDVGNFNKVSDKIENKKVASLKIPLAENTINIENTNHDVAGIVSLNYKTDLKKNSFGLISLVFFVLGIALITYVYFYSIRTRTAAMIYKKEIKNIINNYDSFIQKITGTYDIGMSQVIKLESFNDILEIRDTLKQPILMLENESKNGTFFIIPATNSIIYTYALRVADIEAKMEGREVPIYEVTEIPHSNGLKDKKYTADYIKDEITRTSLTPIVDDENIIKGNKDKETDLYEQLELTRSFSIDEIKRAVKKAKKERDKRAKREQIIREKKEQKEKLKKTD